MIASPSSCSYGNAGTVYMYMKKLEEEEVTADTTTLTNMYNQFCIDQGRTSLVQSGGSSHPSSGWGYSQNGISTYGSGECAAPFYNDHIAPALSDEERAEFHHKVLIFHGSGSNCWAHHHERYSMCAWGGECSGTNGMSWCRTGAACAEISMSTITNSNPHGSSCMPAALYHVYLCI